MSIIVGYRNLHRSQDVQLGDKSVSKTRTGVTWVNVDNPRVYRDLGRHSSLGNIIPVSGPHYQGDDGIVRAGGKVTARASGLVLDVTATQITNAAGTDSTAAAGTATIGAADATNPRIDTVALNTSTGAIVVVAGTATAGANLFNRRGIADLPASRIALAWVLVPANATDVVQANIADVRP